MSHEIDYITPETAPVAEGFGERLVRSNALDEFGFDEWVFHPGMLFNARDKWWGDQGNRNKPHEGLDICLYRTKGKEVLRLNESIRIPVMYGGEVVKTSKDFLGVSIFVCHSIYSNQGAQLLTAYGHLKLYDSVYPGKVLSKGYFLGTVAGTGVSVKVGDDPDYLLVETEKSRSKIFPHLHISVAWISKKTNYEKLGWESIADPGVATLLNPLEIINCRYSILGNI